jgi:hypothetical protein
MEIIHSISLFDQFAQRRVPQQQDANNEKITVMIGLIPSQPIPARGDSVTKAANRPVLSFLHDTGTRYGETPKMELANRGL